MLRINSVSRVIFLLLPMCLGSAAQAQMLRDPTRPANAAVASATVQGQEKAKLKLNSILISNNTATAVFNNQMFKVGDALQGVKIVRIDEAGVSLADGRKFTLYPTVVGIKGK